MPEMNPIAYMHSDFPEKFGIPRQSGLIEELKSRIIFAPEYRDANALKGIEQYSHLWLIWVFSENVHDTGTWSPTVRPPRLGGNERMGVFATRSPFRPNPIGLSCVRLERVLEVPGQGTVLEVSGADLMDGTPILDIKPYLPFTDCHPEAVCAFTQRGKMNTLQVEFPGELLQKLPEEKRSSAVEVLALDPRPRYQEDPQRLYGVSFAGWDIRFHVAEGKLTVCGVEPL